MGNGHVFSVAYLNSAHAENRICYNLLLVYIRLVWCILNKELRLNGERSFHGAQFG
jgi:hypothetical protein